MQRRQFIGLIGGAAAWPLAARAQREAHMRRVGALIAYAETDPQARRWADAFQDVLGKAGWVPGQNLQIDYRWASGEPNLIAHFAKELVALKPDVILSATTPATAAFKHETSTIPIVFVAVSDPIGSGFIESLPRPGGNITGFLNLEGSLGGKWLSLLKEIAPAVTRAALMFNPDTAPGRGEYFLTAFEEAGRKLGVKPIAAPVREAADIERAIADLGSQPGGGLVTESDAFLVVHLNRIISLAEAFKVPAVHGLSQGARQGGLLNYTADIFDEFRRSAGYVDRILKGEKPANLPVQAPTKYELIINRNTAKALGLPVPLTLLALADEVIE